MINSFESVKVLHAESLQERPRFKRQKNLSQSHKEFAL